MAHRTASPVGVYLWKARSALERRRDAPIWNELRSRPWSRTASPWGSGTPRTAGARAWQSRAATGGGLSSVGSSTRSAYGRPPPVDRGSASLHLWRGDEPVTKRDARAANGVGYETYVCVKRPHHGPNACSQRPMAVARCKARSGSRTRPTTASTYLAWATATGFSPHPAQRRRLGAGR